MNEALVDATDAMDRYVFLAGLVITMVLSGLKLFGIIDCYWRWSTSPLWIWVILTVIRSLFIVRPWKKELAKREAAAAAIVD